MPFNTIVDILNAFNLKTQKGTPYKVFRKSGRSIGKTRGNHNISVWCGSIKNSPTEWCNKFIYNNQTLMLRCSDNYQKKLKSNEKIGDITILFLKINGRYYFRGIYKCVDLVKVDKYPNRNVIDSLNGIACTNKNLTAISNQVNGSILQLLWNLPNQSLSKQGLIKKIENKICKL